MFLFYWIMSFTLISGLKVRKWLRNFTFCVSAVLKRYWNFKHMLSLENNKYIYVFPQTHEKQQNDIWIWKKEYRIYHMRKGKHTVRSSGHTLGTNFHETRRLLNTTKATPVWCSTFSIGTSLKWTFPPNDDVSYNNYVLSDLPAA